MTYYAGDKVRIKTFEELRREFGPNWADRRDIRLDLVENIRWLGGTGDIVVSDILGDIKLKKCKKHFPRWALSREESFTVEWYGNIVFVSINGKIGMATCSKDDKFDLGKGIEIALRRAKNPFPSIGDKFFYVTMNDFCKFEILSAVYEENNPFIKALQKQGNFFRTVSSANEYRKKLKNVK